MIKEKTSPNAFSSGGSVDALFKLEVFKVPPVGYLLPAMKFVLPALNRPAFIYFPTEITLHICKRFTYFYNPK